MTKTFNVRSQKAYNKLMEELEGKAVWAFHEYHKPIEIDHFYKQGRNTLIFIEKGIITYGDLNDFDKEVYNWEVFKPFNRLGDSLEIVSHEATMQVSISTADFKQTVNGEKATKSCVKEFTTTSESFKYDIVKAFNKATELDAEIDCFIFDGTEIGEVVIDDESYYYNILDSHDEFIAIPYCPF